MRWQFIAVEWQSCSIFKFHTVNSSLLSVWWFTAENVMIKTTSTASLGPSSLFFSTPDEISQMLTMPSKPPEASNNPS
mgnify:CR=1 FL=1